MTDTLRSDLDETLRGSYVIERELGGGGMSRVFLADETRFGRKVVIKVLLPELAQGISVERFEREIRLAASLQQANIVPVLAAGESKGLPYFTMPFVDGESLRHRLAKGPLPIAEVVSIVRDVSRALSYAHSRGIVHRDIKPDNVLLSAGAAVVTDFGIAKAISAARTQDDVTELTQTGTSIGTPAYMSPEQAAGDPDIDHRADLYALGCMAYELLSGQTPFGGRTPARIIAAHLSEVPTPIGAIRADTPPALADVVMRCLAKEPNARPKNAEVIVQALEGVGTGSGNAATASPAGRTARSVPMTGVIAAAALLLIGGVWLLKHTRADTASSTSKSLAVLPIENSGGDSTKEYLADGMTTELAGELRQTAGIEVVGDLSTSRYKHSKLPPDQIARELGVGMLLAGKLQSQGSSIRLQMQLLDASGKMLWSKQFNREMKDNFAVEDEVTAAIASEMQLVLSPAKTAVARAGRTENPEAHDLYMRAVFEKNKLSEQGLDHAVKYFQDAITLDSNYAKAYAGLAFAYDMLADAFRPSHPYHLLAKAAAEHAVQKDSMLAEAHVLYGFEIAAAEWDFPNGLIEMRRGVALDPNAPDALFMYGLFLSSNGETAEAIDVADRLLRIDPLSAMASLARAAGPAFGRRWAEALHQDSITKKLDATVVYGDAWDGAALRELGHLPESVAAYQAFQGLTGQPAFGLAITYGRMGKRTEAIAILHALEERRKHQWVDPALIASGYAGIGDRDNAMRWLNTGFDEKEFLIRFVNSYWFDGLRDDPRFIALTQKVLATTFKDGTHGP